METQKPEEAEPLMDEQGGDAVVRQDAVDKKFTILFSITQLFGIIALILVVLWITSTLDGFGSSRIFNYHPFFMVLGMVFLYGNGILIYRFMRYQKKSVLKLVHAFLNGLAFVFAVVALIAVFTFHNQANIPNMYSLHSWLGIITVTLFAGQYLLGFLAFLYPGAADAFRKFIMPYHVFMGLTIFGMAVACSLVGITEKAFFSLPKGGYSKMPSAAYIINFMGIFLVLFGVSVTFLATQNKYKRKPLQGEIQQFHATPLR